MPERWKLCLRNKQSNSNGSLEIAWLFIGPLCLSKILIQIFSVIHNMNDGISNALGNFFLFCALCVCVIMCVCVHVSACMPVSRYEGQR